MIKPINIYAISRIRDEEAFNLIESHQSQKEWKERLKSEQKSFDTALQTLIAEHFNKFAEKALRQMADSDLNEWIVRQFMQKIKDIYDNMKNELKKEEI